MDQTDSVRGPVVMYGDEICYDSCSRWW